MIKAIQRFTGLLKLFERIDDCFFFADMEEISLFTNYYYDVSRSPRPVVW